MHLRQDAQSHSRVQFRHFCIDADVEVLVFTNVAELLYEKDAFGEFWILADHGAAFGRVKHLGGMKAHGAAISLQ